MADSGKLPLPAVKLITSAREVENGQQEILQESVQSHNERLRNQPASNLVSLDGTVGVKNDVQGTSSNIGRDIKNELDFQERILAGECDRTEVVNELPENSDTNQLVSDKGKTVYVNENLTCVLKSQCRKKSTKDEMSVEDCDSAKEVDDARESDKCEQNCDEILGNSIEDEEQKNKRMVSPSEDCHTYMLERICRICAEMTVVFEGPRKGVHKNEIVKCVKKIWKVDLSDEDSSRYPINVCQQCERKVMRLYLLISKKKKCTMFRTKPADFDAHTDENCSICSLKEENSISINQGASKGREIIEKANSKLALEPRRNPARKRGWSDDEETYKSVGCQTEEVLEEFSRKTNAKQPLSSVNAKYIKKERLHPLIVYIDKFCHIFKENKIDVMFFLLKQALRDSGDRTRESKIVETWMKKSSEDITLTDEECLAKRVMLKQTKEQYRKEYNYYREKLQKAVIKPPMIIDKLEKTYFPEYLDFYMTNGEVGPVVFQHEKSSQPSYFALPDSNDGTNKDKGFTGARWRYCEAVAKTLEDLAHTFENQRIELSDNTCIHVDISDYCEEKKDLSQNSDKSDLSGSNKTYQRKIITYFFCAQSLKAIIENKVAWTYRLEEGTYRPLMKALTMEGETLQSCLLSVIEERNKMSGKCFHIRWQNDIPLRFIVNFNSVAPEIRRDTRNILGQACSSYGKGPASINGYSSILLELKRSWLATSPRLLQIGRVTNFRIKCSRCGEKGHNVRKCKKSSTKNAEETTLHPKRRKKYRSVPTFTPSNNLLNETSEIAVGPQPHSTADLNLPRQVRELDSSRTHLTPKSKSVDNTNPDSRNGESLYWDCPDIDGGGNPVGGQVPQGTQEMLPSTDVEGQSIPSHTVVQGSQGASQPVYVWTYVVQPQTGSVVHGQTESHQIHQLAALPQHTSLHGIAQQQQQPIAYVHQALPQESLSQPSQHLTLVHPSLPQQTGTTVHQHGTQRPPLDQNAQLLSVGHLPINANQAADSTQQVILGQQLTCHQSQPHQGFTAEHQQKIVQAVLQANTTEPHIPQPQSQSYLPETSTQGQQLPQSQGFYFNVFPGGTTK
ncbi:hypothetical protein SK128_003487 [Halocaridina rubra]|uniref:V(D)J recombination-activating protein 1 n=1 Tax=Halocaridina rubra TaxID=373956 RepID=A0AAN9AC63_HALRR